MTSTPDSIRDRVELLVAGVDPSSFLEDRFVHSLNEGAASFQAWCEQYPQSCHRRFQARTDRTHLPPEMSTLDGDDRYCGIVITVAYPHTQRYGEHGGLSRDNVIDADYGAINETIGVGCAAAFVDVGATPFGCTKAIVRGTSVDFLIVTQALRYQRAL